jgi:hypothetical protein
MGNPNYLNNSRLNSLPKHISKAAIGSRLIGINDPEVNLKNQYLSKQTSQQRL